MKKMRRFFVLTLTAFLLTAVTGCGQAKTEGSEPGETAAATTGETAGANPDDGNWHPDKPVTIKWATWEYNSAEGQEYLNKSLELYKKYQPNITVEYEFIAGDQYQTWLQT